MRDESIVELFFKRDERAIEETRTKYGPYCSRIALGLLSVREDAEECVQDTYLAAWNRMPPERPNVLGTFLGRITRNLAISRYRRNRAEKRYAGIQSQLEELADCLPSDDGVEKDLERRELGRIISRWLDTLSETDRTLFVRRYWYGDRVEELARSWGQRANTLSQRLRRLRLSLRDVLEKEELEDE